MTKLHSGSSLDDFLQESGIYEETTSVALARVLAWQIRQVMDEEGPPSSDTGPGSTFHAPTQDPGAA